MLNVQHNVCFSIHRMQLSAFSTLQERQTENISGRETFKFKFTNPRWDRNLHGVDVQQQGLDIYSRVLALHSYIHIFYVLKSTQDFQ